MAHIDWNRERQKLSETYSKAQRSLSFMRHEAKKSGRLVAEARWAATQRDEYARSRALPLAQAAYNARINAEAARYEAASYLIAQDLRETGLEQASLASMTREATERQPLFTSAQSNVIAADIMEEAAAAAGQAARDKAPPLPKELVQVQEPAGGDMSVGSSYGWRPKLVNEHMHNFYPPDVKAAAGALGALGATEGEANSWWEGFKKALGAGAAAAGSEASKQGQKTTSDDPAAKAAWTASGGTLEWAAGLLNADYVAASKKPPPSAPFPWVPVVIGAGVLGVGGVLLWRAAK